MVQPCCSYFQHCGGCTFQHLEYFLQLENKKKKYVQFPHLKVYSGQEYHYRNRMDFIFNSSGLGLRAKGSWSKIIKIQECSIAEEKINQLLNEINDFFIKESCGKIDAFDVVKHSGTLRFAVIRTTTLNDSSISFVLNPESTKLKEAIELIKKFSETTSAKNVVVTSVPPETDESVSDDYFVVKGNDFLQEKLLDKIFSFSVQGFFQNNTSLAEKMQEYVAELLSAYSTENAFLLDLYGGVGTFGLINADKFLGTTIVESAPSAIEFAQRNILENKLELQKIKTVVLDAKNLFKLFLSQPLLSQPLLSQPLLSQSLLPQLLFVITDPPRSGMDPRAIRYIQELKPKVLIYISCNVEQLVKDLKKFSAYEIKSIALFDLFPQTNHQETIVELVLRK